MQFLSLLGKQLKDDEVLDVLEWGEMEVVYDFDRTHENLPDKYWADAKELGFQLRFNAGQMLDVIFLHTTASEGFDPVDTTDCDAPIFCSVAEVVSHGAREKVRTTQGKSNLFGAQREWARLEYEEHTLHYEFQAGVLTLETLTRAS